MSKVEEKMLNMMVDMATNKGRLEAEQERRKKEIAEKDAQIAELKTLLKMREDRIAELEFQLTQQNLTQPKVTVNQFFFAVSPQNAHLRAGA